MMGDRKEPKNYQNRRLMVKSDESHVFSTRILEFVFCIEEFSVCSRFNLLYHVGLNESFYERTTHLKVVQTIYDVVSSVCKNLR